jgi:release factor glutamine methyltransferase
LQDRDSWCATVAAGSGATTGDNDGADDAMTLGRVGPEPAAIGRGAAPVDRDVVIRRLRTAGCVFAEDEAELLLSNADTAADLEATVTRRVAGEPLEYVLGWAEFAGRRFAIEPGVFVPRHRTEFLVDQAVALAREIAAAWAGMPSVPSMVVLDLCCGSGAIGAAVTAALSGGGTDVNLYATDIEPAAVRCAGRNLADVGGHVFHGDLFEPLPVTLRSRVRILTANVPYVPTAAIAMMPPEARDYEARVTLDGGSDGLAVLRRVAAAAPRWLSPGGHLLVETSGRQAEEAAEVMSSHGLAARIATSEEAASTVVIGTS